MYCKRNIVLVLGLLVSLIGYSQKKTTKKDYQRAASFLWENLNNNKVFNTYIRPYWAEDNSGIAFITRDEKGKYFKKITFKNKRETSLFDHQKVATLINKKLNKEYSEFTLPFNRINYKNKKEILFTVDRKEYILDLKSYSLSENKKEEKNNEFETISPDGKWIAFTRDYNLFIRSTEDGTEHQLSTAGKKNYEYASYYGWYDLMEGENGERPSHFYVNWSPDSKWIQTNICDLRQADKMYLLDWSIDSLYRPKLLSYYRGSPGDTTMVHMKPVVFDITSKKEIHPELPTNTHINAVSLRWSDTNKNMLYADYQNRGYQDVHLLKVDVATGKKQVLYKETSTTNIDGFEYWLIEKRNTAIVASEKSGWRQLYTIDLATGEEKPLTQGAYYIDDILSIDEERGIIYFAANGKEDINPYYSHVYKVDLDQRKTVLLTPEKAHHQALFSPDNNYFVDNYSTAQQPTITVLREAKTGKIVTTMSKADIEKIKATGWQPAQTFTALARDNKTTIYGAYWVPSNFDPNKKYPVIDHTYTGPHTQMFPRSFGRAISLENQAIAELGFIVVMIDGLGSSSRSKAFHNYSYKNLGGNLEDHKRAIEQLAKKHNFIDQERVGIFGHSAGGYDAAHALLQFPEFYKVAVSSSADHDHRMEKAWWPEMYMGWPVDSAYHNQSNVTMAKNLKGKLLLVHGGIDENVNPSATFKLAEALIKANKDFDLLIMPSQHHGYRGKHSAYFRKKRWNYFVEHLLEQQPVWDFEDKK